MTFPQVFVALYIVFMLYSAISYSVRLDESPRFISIMIMLSVMFHVLLTFVLSLGGFW